MIDIDWDRLASLCSTAIAAAGGNEDTAAALTDAVVSAERRGKTAVGVPHLFDYLDARPQGSAVSPVLANLFMHYAFDAWMAREFPNVPFKRYCDDAVVHCVSQRQAHRVKAAIADRMAQVGLQLHPTKTRIVYCKDGTRKGSFPHTSFTFLGFTFQARAARSRAGVKFTSFLPAISKQALKKISGEVRRWRLHRKVPLTMTEIDKKINPIVRGWIQYYGAFYRSALCPLLARINAYLVRWLRKKYKRLRSYTKAMVGWQRITSQYPRLFYHWRWVRTAWQTG